MWPWEHLAFGYLAFSLYSRLRHDRPPDHATALVVAAATQFPDLVDKPLAWSLAVLPSGTSLAHSVFVAPAVIGLVAVVARRRGRPILWMAFAIGYGSHLLGDVVYWVFRGRGLAVGVVLWPLQRSPARDTAGLFTETAALFAELLAFVGSSDGRAYLLLEALFLLGVALLWLLDGRPGLPVPRRD